MDFLTVRNPSRAGSISTRKKYGKHNYILDLPYPISERSGSSLVMSGIEIGGILAVGVDLYVSWKNGTTYGIDKLDYSNKMEAGYLETRLIVIEEKNFLSSRNLW